MSSMTGIELITEERRRQIEERGFTVVHDALHSPQQLADAAIAYAMHPFYRRARFNWWPWQPSAFKPSRNRVRDLAKAGALIAAAIDAELLDR